VSQEIREQEEVYVGMRSRAFETDRRSNRSMRSLTVPWCDKCWDNFCVLSFVTRLLWGISFVTFTRNCIVSLVRQICDSNRGMTRVAKAVLRFPSNWGGSAPYFLPSLRYLVFLSRLLYSRIWRLLFWYPRSTPRTHEPWPSPAVTQSALTWDCHLQTLTLHDCHGLGTSCRCVPWTNVQCQDPVTRSVSGADKCMTGKGKWKE